MPAPKNHHYVPQVYLQRWEDQEKRIWIYDLSTMTYSHRNKRSIMREDYLYSLTFREFNLLTDKQKEFFIEPLSAYQVYLDGTKLDKPDIVKNIVHYEDFEIRKSNGELVKRRHKAALLDEVINGKHPLIETKFGRIEDQWTKTADFFDSYRSMVMARKIILPEAKVLKQHCENLLEFILAMYTRNPYAFLKSIGRIEAKKDISIQNTERRRIFETIQMDFLEGKKKLFDTDKYDIHCIFAAPGHRFFTTDNPVCIRHVFIENMDFTAVFWFPVSPVTLVTLSEKSNNEHSDNLRSIYHYLVTGESVNAFNRYICENDVNIIVSSQKIRDSRFSFSNE